MAEWFIISQRIENGIGFKRKYKKVKSMKGEQIKLVHKYLKELEDGIYILSKHWNRKKDGRIAAKGLSGFKIYTENGTRFCEEKQKRNNKWKVVGRFTL